MYFSLSYCQLAFNIQLSKFPIIGKIGNQKSLLPKMHTSLKQLSKCVGQNLNMIKFLLQRMKMLLVDEQNNKKW